MKLGDVAPDERLAYINKTVMYVANVLKCVLLHDPSPAEHAAAVEKYANAILNGASPMDVFEAIRDAEGRPNVPMYVPPGHFYSPIVNPADVAEHLRAAEAAGPAVAGVAIDRDAMVATWHRLLPLMESFPFPAEPTDGFRYFSRNLAFGEGDARVFSAMIRRSQPRRIVEVGSGFSSALAVDTVERFVSHPCAFTFVEPYADELRSRLGDAAAGVDILEVPVQRAPLALFETLSDGDILFIDSTHVLRTGSDVCFELFEILPRLASGVLVHIHDMFWPFEYPRNWVVDDNRSWNELYAVRAFLTGNREWDVVFFSQYFVATERELVERTLPAFAHDTGAALWLRRR
jgi:hypothetical protein